MYSDLLTPQDIARLSESPDLPALVGILKSTPYPRHDDGIRIAKGVVSRKKQLLPLVLSALEA